MVCPLQNFVNYFFLKGFPESPVTKNVYHLRGIMRYYGRHPLALTLEQIPLYLLHLLHVRGHKNDCSSEKLVLYNFSIAYI